MDLFIQNTHFDKPLLEEVDRSDEEEDNSDTPQTPHHEHNLNDGDNLGSESENEPETPDHHYPQHKTEAQIPVEVAPVTNQSSWTEVIEKDPGFVPHSNELLEEFVKLSAQFATIEEKAPELEKSKAKGKPRPSSRNSNRSTQMKEKVCNEWSLKAFDYQNLLRDAAILMTAPRRGGKTCQIIAILVALAFPRIVLFGKGRDAGSWTKYIPRLYIYDDWDEVKFATILKCQEKFWNLKQKPGFEDLNIDLAIILEDFSSNAKVMRSPAISDLVSNMRRTRILFICSAQYFKSFRPEVRTGFDYYFLFREGNEDLRKILYQSCGGLFPSKDTFFDLLDSSTNERRALVVHRTANDMSCLENFVFHSKAPLYQEKQLGSFEYRLFAQLYGKEGEDTSEGNFEGLKQSKTEKEKTKDFVETTQAKVVLPPGEERIPPEVLTQAQKPGTLQVTYKTGRKERNIIRLCE